MTSSIIPILKNPFTPPLIGSNPFIDKCFIIAAIAIIIILPAIIISMLREPVLLWIGE